MNSGTFGERAGRIWKVHFSTQSQAMPQEGMGNGMLHVRHVSQGMPETKAPGPTAGA